MALPTSADLVAVDGATFLPATLINRLQALFVGACFPSLTEWFTPAIVPVANITPTDGGAGLPPYYVTAAAANLKFIAPTSVGDRITGASVRVFGNAATNCTWNVYAVSLANMGAPVSLGNAVDAARAAAWGDLNIPLAARVMAAGEFLLFHGAANGAGYRVAAASKTSDRL